MISVAHYITVLEQTTKTESDICFYFGCVKRKSAFKYAQIVQIHIILHMRSLVRALSPLNRSIASNDSVLIRQCRRAG